MAVLALGCATAFGSAGTAAAPFSRQNSATGSKTATPTPSRVIIIGRPSLTASSVTASVCLKTRVVI